MEWLPQVVRARVQTRKPGLLVPAVPFMPVAVLPLCFLPSFSRLPFWGAVHCRGGLQPRL